MSVDVLIIAASPDELDAARSVALASQAGKAGVQQWDERDAGTSAPYWYGRFDNGNGQRWSVALARPTGAGGRTTAPLATSLVERLKPSCLAMCGVCAGNPHDVGLGDVVVAEMTYEWDEGEQSPRGFLGEHRQTPLANPWLRAAQDLDPAGLASFGEASEDEAMLWLLERLNQGQNPRHHPALRRYFPERTWAPRLDRFEETGMIARDPSGSIQLTATGADLVRYRLYNDVDGPQRLPFGVHVAPMASGSTLIGDSQIWQSLQNLGVRSIAAVDREAATVATVAHDLDVPHWLVVKGVMDHAGIDKDDRYRAFASRASAEVLFTLLASLQFPTTAPSPSLLFDPLREPTIETLEAVHPRSAVVMLDELPHREVAVRLARARIQVSAEILTWIDRDRAASVLAEMHPERAHEVLEATPPSTAEALRPALEADQAMSQCGQQWPGLGTITSPLSRAASARTPDGYGRTYTTGMVLWRPETGAQPVWHGVAEYFHQLGGVGGRLGFPLSPEEDIRSLWGTTGVRQRFESSFDYRDEICDRIGYRCGATIYWSEAHGPHATWGGIGEYFEDADGAGGRLGFPVSDESEVRSGPRGTAGFCQRFEGGTVYWLEHTSGFSVSGDIGVCHGDLGGATGLLGLPESEEFEALTSPQGTEGVYQRFEWRFDYPDDIVDQNAARGTFGATVYWSTHGAMVTWGGIGALYEQSGGTGGDLGFPTSNEIDLRTRDDPDRRCFQRFEGGEIYWCLAHNAVAVVPPVLNFLHTVSEWHEILGYPVTSQTSIGNSNSDRLQFFERGVVTVRDGTGKIWIRPGP